MAATKGKIYKTTDNGTTWTSVYTSAEMESFQSVFFINGSVGFAVSMEGMILSTADGGQNWNERNLGGNHYLFSVFFANTLTGYILGADGYGGIVLKTENGGDSWFPVLTDKTSMISSIYFTDPQTGYIVGGDGLILKTTTGGMVSVKDPLATIHDFKIFPNPVRDKLFISSDHMVPGVILVSITSISGHEIYEDKYTGRVNFEIDVSGLSGGVYLVRIQTKEGIETKKVVIK
jgi:hypothetical protein